MLEIEIEDVHLLAYTKDSKNLIEPENSSENRKEYSLGLTRDDNFHIDFYSRMKKFLIFKINKDHHVDHITNSDNDNRIGASISAHTKIMLIVVTGKNLANHYEISIKHRDHHSFLVLSFIQEIKIFTHGNGIPDSMELDKKHHWSKIIVNEIYLEAFSI